LDYASNSSIESELKDVVEVARPVSGAGSMTRRRCTVVRKVAIFKAPKGATHLQGGGASTLVNYT
jgi:hypothetical protein